MPPKLFPGTRAHPVRKTVTAKMVLLIPREAAPVALGRTAARDPTRATPDLPAAGSFGSRSLNRVCRGGEQRQNTGVGGGALFSFQFPSPHPHHP